jgi:hypothetical protein
VGHRRSVDLDWFGAGYLDDPMLFAHELIRAGIRLDIGNVQPGTLHAVASGVRVSFFDYPYPLLGPPEQIGGIDGLVAALPDLSAMKLLAVIQRGTRKDFVDVHALLSEFTLAEMIDHFCRKFAVSDPSRLIYSLTYFDEADKEPMPQMLVAIDWSTIQRSLREAVTQWVERA